MSQNKIQVYYHPGFAASIGQHIMPMRKFGLVAEALSQYDWVQLQEPIPVRESDLLRVHSQDYIQAVQTGNPKALAESQKFPWSPGLYPSVCLTNGGLLAAAQEAIKTGYSAALASGFHHSHGERGEGFCTFNGLVVAAEALKAKGQVNTVAVLDMDLHYGNGTAILARTRPWFKTLSIYGNDYWNNTAYRDVSKKMHDDGANHHSAALPSGCDRSTMLDVLNDSLSFLIESGKPDLLLYQAGADPYFEDPYSPLQLNHDDLRERDRVVFEFAKKNAIPIAWVLAGGYTEDVSKVVQVHVNTFHAWAEVYRPKVNQKDGYGK